MKERMALFAVGDSVRVKAGVEDVDNVGWSIEGWQGRVIEVSETTDPVMLLVEWDSRTLRDMPEAVVEQCEMDGLDWARYHLYASDVERATPRDTHEDVRKAREELHDRVEWVSLGEEGRRIQHVLEGASSKDEMGALRAWDTYLRERMTVPFEARVDEFQEHGPLCQGDRVRVHRLRAPLDELYGLLAEVRRGRTTYHIPLADLAAADTSSSNAQPLHDYRVWFANR